MNHGKADILYIKFCYLRVDNPLTWPFTLRVLQTSWILYNTIYPKSWDLSPKTITRGICCPTGPHHKHRDSPSSHCVAILVHNPSNCSYITWRSVTHHYAACWIYSSHSAECSLFCGHSYLSTCTTLICVSFSSMVAVMRKAPSIHGCMRAFMIASLGCATSTCSFNAFTCWGLASCWVKATVCTILNTLSYCTWSSRASVSSRCMVGSSYKVARTSNDSSNSLV